MLTSVARVAAAQVDHAGKIDTNSTASENYCQINLAKQAGAQQHYQPRRYLTINPLQKMLIR